LSHRINQSEAAKEQQENLISKLHVSRIVGKKNEKLFTKKIFSKFSSKNKFS
jgi:hypothetical protein